MPATTHPGFSLALRPLPTLAGLDPVMPAGNSVALSSRDQEMPTPRSCGHEMALAATTPNLLMILVKSSHLQNRESRWTRPPGAASQGEVSLAVTRTGSRG